MSKVSKITCIFLPVYLNVCLSIHSTFADNADVMPKGVTNIDISSDIFIRVDGRYDEDNNREKIGEIYNDNLDNEVFANLSKLEEILGLPDGFANVGKSDLSIAFEYTRTNIKLKFGITDKLTAGIFVPIWRAKNNVNAKVDSSSDTIGKNRGSHTGIIVSYADQKSV